MTHDVSFGYSSGDVQARLNSFSMIASRLETAERTGAAVIKLKEYFEEKEGHRSQGTRVGVFKSEAERLACVLFREFREHKKPKLR